MKCNGYNREEAEKKASEESAYLLEVLKGFMYQQYPGPFSGDWFRLIRLAERQAVTGILGYMTEQYPAIFTGQENNDAWSAYLRNQFLNTLVLYTRREERAKLRMKQMNLLGIRHMVLKGFVTRDYYPVTQLRTYCDIDILISLEQRKQCDDWMMKEGFRRKTDWEPVYSYYKGEEFYEIHTELMDQNLTGKEALDWFTREAWEHAVRVECDTWVMEKEYHLVYLFVHLAKHLEGTGAGIRMYLDLALMIRAEKEQLDWIKIKSLCERMGIVGFVRIIFAFLNRYLEVKLPKAAEEAFDFGKETIEVTAEDLYEKGSLLLLYTFSGGTFGSISERAGLVFAEKCGMVKTYRGPMVVRKLLPGSENLKKRYTYLEEKPWLLPAAWIHRILKNMHRWRECIAELRAIMKLDHKKLEERKSLERQIELS